jgi:UDP-N-acetyl-D-mannosaminuronate dehydrogenase
VVYTDPHVPEIEVEGRRYTSVSEADARTADLAIITTDHSAFDLVALARDGRLILDTRNATRRAGVPAEYLHKVVRL